MFAVFNPYLTDNNLCWASELIHRHGAALTITNVSVMHRYVQVIRFIVYTCSMFYLRFWCICFMFVTRTF